MTYEIAVAVACESQGSQANLARTLGVAPAVVSHWLHGKRPVPARFCPAIERATGGAVTRRDLRPDDWAQIWPELAQGQQIPAVAAIKNEAERVA